MEGWGDERLEGAAGCTKVTKTTYENKLCVYERLRGKSEQNKSAPVKCYLEAVGKPFSNSLCIFSVIAITLPREYWQLRLYATEHVHTPTSILYILYFNGI